MGILNNSTNAVIVDTVLTDLGRALAAKNDGSFSVTKFSLSDDEIDYRQIRHYGRTIGKEKIEKNTIVFEALTNQNFAQKYRLISISNPNLIRLPSISLSGDSAVSSTTSTVTLGRTIQTFSSILLEQTISSEPKIDVELRDQVFQVELNDLFLQIDNQTPDSIDSNRKASYLLVRSPSSNSQDGSRLQFTLKIKSITDAQFSVYGSSTNKSVITTYVRVRGLQSGSVKEFRVDINKVG